MSNDPQPQIERRGPRVIDLLIPAVAFSLIAAGLVGFTESDMGKAYLGAAPDAATEASVAPQPAD